MHFPQKFCRLCANLCDESSLLQIFEKGANNVEALDKLICKYMPLTVRPNDTLSLKICKVCRANVVRWHRFVVSCVKAQQKLKNLENQHAALGTTSCMVDSKIINAVSIFEPTAVSSLETNRTVKKRKSTYCAARWCNNAHDVGTSLFRIPKDRKRALQWLSAADRNDLATKDTIHLNQHYLCSSHFEKNMFVNENCRSLNPGAVPSIFHKPVYARKIEQDLINATTYPTELQGVKLKTILPKPVQVLKEISPSDSSSSSNAQQQFASLLRIAPKSNQVVTEQLQPIEVVEDSVPTHPNINIISVPQESTNLLENVQFLNVEDHGDLEGGQCQVFSLIASLDCENIESSKTLISEDMGFVAPQQNVVLGESNYYVSDDLDISQENQEKVSVKSSNSLGDGDLIKFTDLQELSISNKNHANVVSSLMDFTGSNEEYIGKNSSSVVLELAPESEDRQIIVSDSPEVNFSNDQHVSSHPLDFKSVTMDSLSSVVGEASSFTDNQSSGLLDQNVVFGLKENVDSTCVDDLVCSQDFLLMHSPSSQVQEIQVDSLRQGDQNLNNLCDTISRETVSESRSIIAQTNERTIECTSPNHGEMIEGLIDLDQFLDGS